MNNSRFVSGPNRNVFVFIVMKLHAHSEEMGFVQDFVTPQAQSDPLK